MSDQPTPSDVLLFWFGGPGEHGKRHKRWFEKNAAFDREMRERFLPAYEQAAQGALSGWKDRPADCLALILVLDQFPRNAFRGTPRAFATDPLALDAARHAVALGYDRDMLPVERLFAYLPFEHSEALADQERACELCRPLAAVPRPRTPTATRWRTATSSRASTAFPTATRFSGGRARPRKRNFCSSPGQASESVIAPREALDTSRMYLASRPFV